MDGEEDREMPDEETRRKEAALARLRSAALENIELRDILTLLGY
jgi:hypothetical protein